MLRRVRSSQPAKEKKVNRYWRLYKKSRGPIAVAIAMSLFELAVILPVPVLVKSLFDEAVRRGQTSNVIGIVLAACGQNAPPALIVRRRFHK